MNAQFFFSDSLPNNSPNNGNMLLLLSLSVPLSSVVLCEFTVALNWEGVNNGVNKAGH